MKKLHNQRINTIKISFAIVEIFKEASNGIINSI